MTTKLPRRKVLRNIGIGAASLSAVSGSAAAKKDRDKSKSPDDSPKDSNEDDDPEITPEYVTNWTSEWSPYTIQEDDTSILKSKWDVITPTLASYHRFDALVEASKVKRPQMVGTNIGSGSVKKNWEYTENTALGVPAYHFKAKMWVVQPTGSQLYLDSRVEPKTTGTIEGRTGCYDDPTTSLAEVWSRAYLTVE
ncbi:hypothetical protein EGH22_19465 [Halomicroarcula sp. F28]|uniref:hypothetical protein n=1 Tax=Haloarcula salinisoli TaxID=2487746 RepID=UPI001C72A2C5|nr:hypothetical protein [Halomicroarcula salinisoli]MBX0288512.1 hypothetical protein [Halomicroarcula salinisoli]